MKVRTRSVRGNGPQASVSAIDDPPRRVSTSRCTGSSGATDFTCTSAAVCRSTMAGSSLADEILTR
jgi:hypothetical protein